VRTINIRGAILLRKEKKIPGHASFQGYFTEVCFDTSKLYNFENSKKYIYF
jgi:hypothetical protein